MEKVSVSELYHFFASLACETTYLLLCGVRVIKSDDQAAVVIACKVLVENGSLCVPQVQIP